MNWKAVFLLLICFGFFSPVSAQWQDSVALPQGMAEDWEESLLYYATEGYEEVEEAEWQAALEDALENPQNINALDEHYLKQVLRLTAYQYYHLCRYVDLYGAIQSYAEVAAVEGFSTEWVLQYQPYFTVGKPVVKSSFSWKRLPKGKGTLLVRSGQVLEKQAAYQGENPAYEGNPMQLLVKCSYRCGDFLRLGWTAEKDAGESFFRKSNRQGFDYNGFYLSYQGKGFVRQLLLGNYQLHFGQGIAMAMGFQLQSSDPESAGKSNFIKAHTSAGESQFLQGAACRLQLFPNGSLSLFASMQRTDAAMNLSDTGSLAERLAHTGYHRTISERAKEKALRQLMCGAYGECRYRSFCAGSGVYLLSFAAPIQQQSGLYNLFAFHGSDLVNYSADYQWNLKKILFFGELAMDSRAAMACCNGLVVHADDRLDISLLWQCKSKAFQSVSALLQSASGYSNVHSLSLKAKFLVGRQGVALLTWDECRYPWLKYAVESPSRSSALYARWDGKTGGSLQYSLLYQWKRAATNQSDLHLRGIAYPQIHRGLLRLTCQPQERWHCKVQLDFRCLQPEGASVQKGLALTQYLIWKGEKVQLTTGYSLFDAENQSVALYVSEPDLSGAASSVCYSGRGMHAVLLCSWKPCRGICFYAKYSRTRYADRQSIGSGATLIEGNHKSYVKLQMVWKF